jgi:hypothetical protein
MFAAQMGTPDHVLGLCGNLKLRIKETSDLDSSLERFGRIKTSL